MITVETKVERKNGNGKKRSPLERIPVLYTNELLLPGTRTKLTVPTRRARRIIDTFEKNETAKFINVLHTPGNEYKVGVLVRVVEVNQFNNLTQLVCDTKVRVEIKTLIKGYYPVVTEYKSLKELHDITPQKMIQELKQIEIRLRDFKFDDNNLAPTRVNDYLQVLIMFFTEKYRIDANNLQKEFIEEIYLSRLLANLKRLIEDNINSDQNLIDVPAEDVQAKIKEVRARALKTQKMFIDKELEKLEESNDLFNVLKESGIKEEYHEKIKKEIERYYALDPNNGEYFGLKKYLDTLFALPWKKETVNNFSLNEAAGKLNANHYGMDEVKTRILDQLAVMKRKNNRQGGAILLVGPPGTGKTSLAQSIAESLNRKYARIALGGTRDEAVIRGHRRTYVGALPGRIVQTLEDVKVSNPVFVLDEIDKLLSSYQGDPESALLEVLDPEQNNSFVDNYLAVPFDLSDVLFIATANSLATISAPLRDRLEVIEISSYNEREKVEIAKDYLTQKVFEKNGIEKKELLITDKAYEKMIKEYTKEAGVRRLEKLIAKVVRTYLRKSYEEDFVGLTITEDNLHEYLGVPIFIQKENVEEKRVGQVVGLAYTPVGGDTLKVQAITLPGSGKLQLTGQLGEVMRESASIAYSVVKNEIKHFNYDDIDIHLHVPAGAVPKDGPSAGITMYTVLKSLITESEISQQIAMTGELTLTGDVTAIGGLKEKLTAAYNQGIKKVYIPEENKLDIEEIDGVVKENLQINPVSHVNEIEAIFARGSEK